MRLKGTHSHDLPHVSDVQVSHSFIFQFNGKVRAPRTDQIEKYSVSFI